MNLRRVVLALAVLSLFAGLASAQILNVGQLNCTVSAASTPTLRAEGKNELVGDVLVKCTGGTAPVNASLQVPGVDIVVDYGTAITSRLKANAAATITYSDALLMIDDPNNVAPAASAVPNLGNSAQIHICAAPVAIPAGGSTVPLCPTFSTLNPAAPPQYYTATNAAGLTNAVGNEAANAYQGIVSGTKVYFYGVPLVAPVTAGVYRQFRITNIRVTPTASAVTATVTAAGPNATALAFSGSTSAVVSATALGFTTSVSQVGYFSQCITPDTLAGVLPASNKKPFVALLNFKENFANAAKIQGGVVVAPAQNLYSTYTAESGTVPPAGAPGLPLTVVTATAGLADAGTRFKATFTNLPTTANADVYVSLFNVNTGTAASPFITDLGSPAAAPNSAELTTAGQAAVFTAGAGGLPVNGGLVQAIKITPASGTTATAVWQVLKNDATAAKTYTFAVYIVYNAATPATAATTVTLDLAPISPASGDAVQIPQFISEGTATAVMAVVPCQTTLLFPFVSNTTVTATTHWETGVSIQSTGADPYNTVVPPSTPSTTTTCSLSFYGPGAPSPITTAAIAPGTAYLNTLTGIGATNFTGYMFAVCNFQYAHGFAFIEDDTKSMAMGYLALVVDNSSGLGRSVALNGERLGN
jgi:hypothetical protein